MEEKFMLAISWSDYEKYGCPNCGCDRAITDNCYRGDQPGVTCKSCNLHFQILADGLTRSSVEFGTGRKDSDGKDILECPIFVVHPRKGTPHWHYEMPDVKPEYGEYWKPREIGYDLSGFVKSKPAGERLLELTKEVLGKEKPDSWLDWRKDEPEWIQFKFQKNEFDLEKLRNAVIENDCIISKEILMKCRI